MADDAPKPPKHPFRYETSDLIMMVALCGGEGFAFGEWMRSYGNAKPLYAVIFGMVLGILFMFGGGYIASRHCTERKIESRGKRFLYLLAVNAMLFCFVGAAVFWYL